MYYFFLGNTPELSKLELSTLYPGDFNLVTKAIVSYSGALNPTTLFRLGGTRKVAELLTTCPPSDTVSCVTELISADSAKNIALTDYADLALDHGIFHTIKSQVKRSLRFVSLETTEHELLMLSHQHVSEYNLLPAGDSIAIAKTVWIYDAEDWVRRDRDKPYRDIKRGMLPPKVARIMVNLATQGKSGLTLADPFCGTGTILAEGMMVGCNVVGGDTNPAAIAGSESNLAWLCSQYLIPNTKYQILNLDATHFHEHVATCDCLATEPYMGPLLDDRNPSSLDKIKNIARGLDKLYRGAFKSFHRSLPVGGRVVITIPSFHVYDRVIPTISIDTLGSLGYNYVSSVAYGKPGAAVVRNITILEKQ
ncbi:MAG: hypothetical protein V1487_02585 [bacterium]